MTVAYVARGIARAIHDNGQRAILGVVGRDFGFLYFMREMGVTWDVTGAHFYQNANSASLLSDSWWGTNGPLYQLSLFGKPITVNEFNCGEIYNYPNIDNEACLKSVNKQLTELNANPYGTIESVLFYEMTDGGGASAEGVFGLMYNLSSPKTNLYLSSAWACGQLSSTEKQQLTSRGLRDGSTCGSTPTTTTPTTTTPTTTAPAPTTTTDTIAPTVTITNPANGQTLSRGSNVTVQATATDNVGVNWYGFYLNGTPLCTGNIKSCTMRMPKTRGSQTIEVRAADAAMNHGRTSITVYTR
jgi:hypothetical protein